MSPHINEAQKSIPRFIYKISRGGKKENFLILKYVSNKCSSQKKSHEFHSFSKFGSFLCARLYARHLGYSCEQDGRVPALKELKL